MDNCTCIFCMMKKIGISKFKIPKKVISCSHEDWEKVESNIVENHVLYNVIREIYRHKTGRYFSIHFFESNFSINHQQSDIVEPTIYGIPILKEVEKKGTKWISVVDYG